jgi:hypothetical protein
MTTVVLVRRQPVFLVLKDLVLVLEDPAAKITSRYDMGAPQNNLTRDEALELDVRGVRLDVTHGFEKGTSDQYGPNPIPANDDHPRTKTMSRRPIQVNGRPVALWEYLGKDGQMISYDHPIYHSFSLPVWLR